MVKPPKNRTWRVLGSRYLAREPWFTVRDEEVQLPSGHIVPHWYVLEYPEWVNIIARTDDGDFIMISQYRHALGRADYELVAGVVDSGEEPLEAARRELEEETGYGGGTWREYMTLSANPTSHNNLSHTFIAEGVRPVAAQHQEPSEDIFVYRFTANEVRELLTQGRIVQSLMAAPLWRYFAEHHLL